MTRSTLKQYRHSEAVTDILEFPDRAHSLTIDQGLARSSRRLPSWLPAAQPLTPWIWHLAGQDGRRHRRQPGNRAGRCAGWPAEGVTVVAGARDSTAELDELADAPVHPVAGRPGHAGRAGRLVERPRPAASTSWSTTSARCPPRPADSCASPTRTGLAMTLNLLVAVRTTRAALPHLLAGAAGDIVNVSSVNAFLPDPAVIDYSAAKAALASFSKALSKEVGPRASGSIPSAPGRSQPICGSATAGSRRRSAGPPARSRRTWRAGRRQTVTGRFTQPDEVADQVVFLASDRAGNVTGADFSIDGGLITTLSDRRLSVAHPGQAVRHDHTPRASDGQWPATGPADAADPRRQRRSGRTGCCCPASGGLLAGPAPAR